MVEDVAAGTSTLVASDDGAPDPLAAFATERLPRPLEDPFVRGFMTVLVHLRRFAPQYAVGLAWLLVMAFAHAPKGPTTTDLAGASSAGVGQPVAAAPAPAEAAAGTSVDLAVGYQPVPDSGAEIASSYLGSTDTVPVSVPEAYTADTNTSTVPTPTTVAANRPLTIAASGYASQTGGTPLESAAGIPDDGLPVEIAGGQASRISYVRLTGDLGVLYLAEHTATGTNVNNTSAIVKACPATSAWTADRGAAMSSAPTYDSANCVTAERNSTTGVWKFDLTGRSPTSTNGFVIVPYAGTGNSFRVTFLTAAVKPPSS